MEKKRRPDNLVKTLLRLFSYFKGLWPLVILIVFAAMYSGVAEIIVTRLAGGVTDHLIETIGQDSSTRISLLISDLIPILILSLVGVLCALFETEAMVRITQRVLYRLRKELMHKVQKLPISYFDQHTHGEIMTYFTNDIDSVVNALSESFANTFLSFTKIIGTIVTLFLINVPLSMIVIVFILIMFIFMFFNARATKKYFRKQQNALANVNSVVEEDVGGVKVIKAFGHEKESFEKFMSANGEWRDASQSAFYHTQLNIPFFVSLSYFNFSISSVCGVLALCTGWAGALTFGGLQSYLVLTRNACQPFNFFTIHLNNFLVASAGAERIFRFLDEKEEVNEGTAKLEKISDEEEEFEKRYVWKVTNEDGTISRVPLKGEICFNHVSFSYVKGKPVLQDISFEAHPGKKSAFVGSTGAGKTTIISLLARFYPIDSGAITYDGINIENIELESLRKAISMVTQDTHLFTGTIQENIRYVRLHSSLDEVKEASKMSHADSFIRRLPEGYDTMLYDDGNNLSAGQRQLLGLARASLNRPPVMILDEATSNIDTRSELLIQEGLNALMKKRTVMIIAHRLSTIRDADEIMVLDHGRIIERGTQDELLALKGAYYDLYTGKTELA